LIEQAMRRLPAGPVNVPIAEKFPLPDKLTVYNSMEGLIQHFELIMPNRGFEAPRDEVYAAVESPNGELGYYLVADGSQTAWRVRTRPPSFIHFAVFPLLIKDHLIADVVAVLGSLNIIAAELDR
jgi:NADH-quinone oxidoreductase subunit D